MNETIKKLFEEMNRDKEFAEKILSLKEIDEVIALAKEKEITLTAEDIEEANRLIAESTALARKQAEGGELSEEELEAVAGGTFGAFLVSVTATAISATIAASASAGFSISASASAAISVTSAAMLITAAESQ